VYVCRLSLSIRLSFVATKRHDARTPHHADKKTKDIFFALNTPEEMKEWMRAIHESIIYGKRNVLLLLARVVAWPRASLADAALVLSCIARLWRAANPQLFGVELRLAVFKSPDPVPVIFGMVCFAFVCRYVDCLLAYRALFL
jgi:hypothetical protein